MKTQIFWAQCVTCLATEEVEVEMVEGEPGRALDTAFIRRHGGHRLKLWGSGFAPELVLGSAWKKPQRRIQH